MLVVAICSHLVISRKKSLIGLFSVSALECIGHILNTMRIIYTLAFACLVLVMHYFDNPEGFRSVARQGAGTIHSLWNDKKVRLEGLQVLSEREIEPLLPLSKSVLWWQVNESDIQAELMQIPWIKSVSVESCHDSIWSRWGCFLLSIKEREPVFTAVVDETKWVVDAEGAFIVPFSDLLHRRYDIKLVSIAGLASREYSPDMVRSQVYSANKYMRVLQQSVAKAVVSLSFLDHEDLSVEFQGIPFPIVFGLDSEGTTSLAEQGKRCAALLKRLEHQFHEIEKIDLAFDRVGVVAFRTK